jgi:molybdate transport system regulatory protein
MTNRAEVLQVGDYRSQYPFCQETIMQAEILLTLKLQQRLFADPRRIALLKQIDQTGSISQGAKHAGISYKSAWDAINEMNQLSEQPLVDRATGGKAAAARC